MMNIEPWSLAASAQKPSQMSQDFPTQKNLLDRNLLEKNLLENSIEPEIIKQEEVVEDKAKTINGNTGTNFTGENALQLLDTLGLTSSQGNETHKIEHILELIRNKDKIMNETQA